MLGGGVGEDARGVRDDDVPLARRLEIDVVEADRVVGDDAELRSRRVEERLVDGNRRRHDDSVGADRRRDELERLGELPLDLRRYGRRLVDAWPQHRRYSSTTRGRCDEE